MSRSFYIGTEDRLYTGSNAFSALINASPTDYGLTQQQATAYAALNTAWGAAYQAANSPETRTRGTIAAKNAAKAQLKKMAAELARIIQANPDVTEQQKADLGLAVRGVPGPVPPPGTPYRLRVTLNADGSLDLWWKCDNPSGCTGVIYQISRRAGAGEFAYIGATGSRRFTDATLPSGVAGVTYRIQGVRSTAAGPQADFAVNFGTAANGVATALVTDVETAPKMAA